MLMKLVIVGTIFVSTTVSTVAQTKGSFSLSIAPTSQTIGMGTTANITVSLRNVSKADIKIYEDKSRDASLSYGFDVLDADETRQCMTEAYASFRDHKNDCLTPKPSSKVFVNVESGVNLLIKPGAELPNSTNLSKLFTFTSAGTYTVQARRFDDVSKTLIKSNVATIIVVGK
jgi:hypothetical protein